MNPPPIPSSIVRIPLTMPNSSGASGEMYSPER